MKKFFLALIWLAGLAAFFLSFFFGEQKDFSPFQSGEEQTYKNTSFTRLTNRLRIIYLILLSIFFLFLFLYNYYFFS